MRDDISALLDPRSIAIIGASTDQTRVGGRVLRLLQRQGYQGEIYLVNPNRDEIAGLPTYKTVQDIGAPIDLALICVPASLVPDAVDQCGQSEVRTVYVMTAGFEGVRAEGKEMYGRLTDAFSRWSQLRLAGPNGVGFFNAHDRVAVTFSGEVDFDPGSKPVDPTGNIAVISQSGGLGFAIYGNGLARGLGFSHVISTGNEFDLEVTDFLEYLLDDARTKVAILFVEGFRNPGRLLELLPRYLDAGKSLVIAKMGASEEARLASVSHTGHAAGEPQLYSAVFEHFGVYEASDLPDLLDAAAALSCWDSVDGRGVGIVTGSGGSGVWVADACGRAGLAVPELEPARQAAILASLPYYASARNPVDVTAGGAMSSGMEAGLLNAVSHMAQSERIDVAVLVGVGGGLSDHADGFGAVVRAATVPVLAYAHHPPSVAALVMLRELGVPCFQSPAGVARGITALRRRGAAEAELSERRDTVLEVHPTVAPPSGPVLTEHEVKDWLRSAGYPVPVAQLVQASDQAVTAAREIGFPVALKAQSLGLPHKAFVGGVALSLHSVDDVRAAFDRIVTATAELVGPAGLEGVLVEPMAPDGVEMLIGLRSDPDLGAFVVFGSGGVLTEISADVVVMPAPVSSAAVHRRLEQLRCWPSLYGRDRWPERDVDAFCQLVSRISVLGHELVDTIQELDLNPVIVHDARHGFSIVDGLAVVAETQGALRS